ncbi:glycosyltransferase family 1 protein [Nodosilinea sp. AN01ver1]|uniref:glycosyltransferase family 1 protein n=1 Tax=Nodosilinea sp. AN01ver1 TaxID=3423362 RepID=UPI003D3178C2
MVGDPTWVGDNQLDGFYTTKVTERSAKVLFAQLVQVRCVKTVLLHYVGYGYAKRGCPKWLVDGLLHWKASYPKACLITMFHEVAASGLPWTSAFWLSGSQHQLAKRLVLLSDRILTSKHSYAELLQNYAPERFATIPTLPVFSTVGELQNPSSLSERACRLVVFGGCSKRTKVYEDSLEQLRQICQYLDVQKILDIGPPLSSLPANIGTVPITAMGCLSSEKISVILSGSIAGFFNYSPTFLGKSTIFAAYCAHRVIPISATMSDLYEEGLQPGKHYALSAQYNTEKKDLALMQSIADNAYSWYQVHNLRAQAQAYNALLYSLNAI